MLLHGFLDHSGTWDLIIEELPSEYVCIALDFRGHGDSDWAPSSVSAYYEHDFIIDTILFIQKIRGEILPHFIIDLDPNSLPIFLFGHSFGGAIALACVANNSLTPQSHVSGAVVLDTVLLLSERTSFDSIYDNCYELILRNTLNARKKRIRRIYKTKEEAMQRIARVHVSNNPKVALKLAEGNVKRIGGYYTFKMDSRLTMRFAGNAVPEILMERLLTKLEEPVLVLIASKGLLRGKKLLKNMDFGDNAEIKHIPGGHHCHMEKEAYKKVLECVSQFLENSNKKLDSEKNNAKFESAVFKSRM